MDKITVLSTLVNKYIKIDYPIIDEIIFTDIEETKNDRLNFKFLIYCSRNNLKDYLGINDTFLNLILNPSDNTISPYFINSNQLFMNENFNIDEIKKIIKFVIKIVYSQRINNFEYRIKVEEGF
jgi:hypothetical protein